MEHGSYGSKALENGVMTLTLDRQQRGNSLRVEHHSELAGDLDAAGMNPAVRCVVLRGAGDRFFCTGADLSSENASDEAREQRVAGGIVRSIELGWQRSISAILDCPKPVVAAVNGTAAGGGLHLALACDLVIAVADASLIEIFVKRGLAPDAAGAYLLTRSVGPRLAKELMFYGDALSGVEAASIGLITTAVPRGEFDDAVAATVGRLAKSPTVALGMAKRLVNQVVAGASREESFKHEAMGQEFITQTEDAAEGLRAFLERRDPVFRGV